jgi:hypothetical protein
MTVNDVDVGINLNKTTTTSVSGIPVRYDEGYAYGSIYYDKWYVESGDVNTVDEPTFMARPSNVIISTREEIPRITIKNE